MIETALAPVDDWRCDDDRFFRSLERAERLIEMGATRATNFYDDKEDYMIIDFVLDGIQMTLRTYKIFTLVIEGKETLRFNGEYEFFTFLENKWHQ